MPATDPTAFHADDAVPGHGYVGRFAPSPTGPLHAGSLVAALASALDARAHRGRWLLRIEDLDPPREVPGAADAIVVTLRAHGFEPDGPILRQRDRHDAYRDALARLRAMGRVYPCACTRKEIADALSARGIAPARHHDAVYPGTCRQGLPPGRTPRAWRLRIDGCATPAAAAASGRSDASGTNTPAATSDARPATNGGGPVRERATSPCIDWQDRNGDRHREDLRESTGDVVLRRADGLWAYQLAVVVDDAAQGVTDVVRGADLIGSTARQILLQRLLGYPTPRYLHVPLVLDAQGEKLAKQTGARALDDDLALENLHRAAAHLGLPPLGARTPDAFWRLATDAWRDTRLGSPPASLHDPETHR